MMAQVRDFLAQDLFVSAELMCGLVLCRSRSLASRNGGESATHTESLELYGDALFGKNEFKRALVRTSFLLNPKSVYMFTLLSIHFLQSDLLSTSRNTPQIAWREYLTTEEHVIVSIISILHHTRRGDKAQGGEMSPEAWGCQPSIAGLGGHLAQTPLVAHMAYPWANLLEIGFEQRCHSCI